jgi:Domain of unknown function (DUF1996)
VVQVHAGPGTRVIASLVAVLLGAVAFLIAWARNSSSSEGGDFYVAIENVPRERAGQTIVGPDASTGSFRSDCGRNRNGHRNHDNLITAPGERGGAHHLHEYVGNVSTDASSTDSSLAAADTTCSNGDRSTYYWPVVRAAPADDASHSAHGGAVLQPSSVQVRFEGNPAGQVVPMPRFLRVVAGDSEAATSADPVALARWGCTGSPGRYTFLYPRCPSGQRVVRMFEFPSCWDGRRTDSPDHRAHVSFPTRNGSCPGSTFPIPRLQLRVTYEIPSAQEYSVDTLPDQNGSPLTDHADFINVMSQPLMARAVACINTGRDC